MIQRLYSAQARGEITFTLTYLLQLRLCFRELPYQLRIRFVPGSVPFEESEKRPCVQEMFFSHGNKQRILSWTSHLQECSALVESLVCKHFSTFLIPCSLHGSPPGSPIPGILQARTLEWVAISFSDAWKWKVKVKSLSRVRLFEDCSLPRSSTHGIFRARVLEWGAIALFFYPCA